MNNLDIKLIEYVKYVKYVKDLLNYISIYELRLLLNHWKYNILCNNFIEFILDGSLHF